MDDIEKELIENEVTLFKSVVPAEDQVDDDQYFKRYDNQCDALHEDLEKQITGFKEQLTEVLESTLNKENIQGRGQGTDKKSDEDRRGEQ